MNKELNTEHSGKISSIIPESQEICITGTRYKVLPGLFNQVLEHYPVGRLVKAEITSGNICVALVGQDVRKG